MSYLTRVAKRVASSSRALGYIRFIIDNISLSQGREKIISVEDFLGPLVATDVEEAINLFNSDLSYIVELYPFLDRIFYQKEFKPKFIAEVLSHSDFENNLNVHGCVSFFKHMLRDPIKTVSGAQNLLSIYVFNDLYSDALDHLEGTNFQNVNFYVLQNLEFKIVEHVNSEYLDDIIVRSVYALKLENGKKAELVLSIEDSFDDYAQVLIDIENDREATLDETEVDISMPGFLDPFVSELLCRQHNPTCQNRCLSFYGGDALVNTPAKHELALLNQFFKKRIPKEDWFFMTEMGCRTYLTEINNLFRNKYKDGVELNALWRLFLANPFGADAADMYIDIDRDWRTTEEVQNRLASPPDIEFTIS